MSVRRLAIVFVVAVTMTVGVAAAIVKIRNDAGNHAEIRASGIPMHVSTSLAYLMGLSTIPTKLAPDFSLTDQNGRQLSLRSLRGRPVVLEFMDSHCIDICPIISQELINAVHDLTPNSMNTAFVAVNVNMRYNRVTDVRIFSQEHQLTSLPTWHFFTGSPSDLQKIWSDYAIYVSAPTRNADIIHSGIIYFIDPQGHERYIASPMVDHTSTGAAYLPGPDLVRWGKGIALVADSLSR